MLKKTLIGAATAVFEDGYYYLNELIREEYTQSLAIYLGASVGQHTRHWIEFFYCLFDHTQKGRQVAYDRRQRNLLWQSEPEAAMQVIEQMKAALEAFTSDESLYLLAEVSDGEVLTLPTTFSRELWVVTEHAIHHMAIIKIGLVAAFPHIQLPTHFGIASSTINNARTAVEMK